MKITLDLPSVLTGGAVALVLGLFAGFTPQVTQVPGATNVAPRQITGQFSPHPSDFVWLRAELGQPSALLTVPQGRVLVLTGVSASLTGGINGCYSRGTTIEIDGQAFDFSLVWACSTGSAVNRVDFQDGIPLVEGQTVRLTNASPPFAWLHGYWADA